MITSRKFMMCVAVGVLASCRGEHSGSTQSAAAVSPERATQRANVEEVYVARARFSSPNLPVTSFCDPAQFPADYPVERERNYAYWSMSARSTDGVVVDENVQRLGGHHGCYSVNKNGMIYAYMTGTFVGIPFTARGTCVFNPERAPYPGVSPYTCSYAFSDLPSGYVGGQVTWNGATTDEPGYLTTTIGTIRLWKKRASR